MEIQKGDGGIERGQGKETLGVSVPPVTKSFRLRLLFFLSFFIFTWPSDPVWFR